MAELVRAHAGRRGIDIGAGFIQAAHFKLRQKREPLLLRHLVHILHIGEFSRVRHADGNLPAVVRDDLHHNARGHIAGQHGLAARAQRLEQRLVLAQIRLREHGFILPLRVAESFVGKNIRRRLRERARAQRKQPGAQQHTSLSFHRESPLWCRRLFSYFFATSRLMAESCASANMNIRLMGSIALSVALSIMPMSKLANVIMQSPSARAAAWRKEDANRLPDRNRQEDDLRYQTDQAEIGRPLQVGIVNGYAVRPEIY